MTDPTHLTPYLESEIEALEPLDFLALAPVRDPLHVLELRRTEEGRLQLRVPGRPFIAPGAAGRGAHPAARPGLRLGGRGRPGKALDARRSRPRPRQSSVRTRC